VNSQRAGNTVAVGWPVRHGRAEYYGRRVRDTAGVHNGCWWWRSGWPRFWRRSCLRPRYRYRTRRGKGPVGNNCGVCGIGESEGDGVRSTAVAAAVVLLTEALVGRSVGTRRSLRLASSRDHKEKHQNW